MGHGIFHSILQSNLLAQLEIVFGCSEWLPIGLSPCGVLNWQVQDIVLFKCMEGVGFMQMTTHHPIGETSNHRVVWEALLRN